MSQQLVALAEQLNQIRQQIEQSQTFPGSDPALMERLGNVLAQMRAVTKEAMAQMESEVMAAASEMRQKADEMQSAQQAAMAASQVAPPPLPEGPWETWQGLDEGAIPPLVASLLELVHHQRFFK